MYFKIEHCQLLMRVLAFMHTRVLRVFAYVHFLVYYILCKCIILFACVCLWVSVYVVYCAKKIYSRIMQPIPLKFGKH